ncbi:MAG: ATP-binding cassette domain-containing protein [Cytophagales bacterium]|nr:ATP-binding cassette domain-containing protein [Cytophagales bacterium]
MSSLLLKVIIRLLAMVAKEDGVTTQEREQVEAFLGENLNPNSIFAYMSEFDDYVDDISFSPLTGRDEIKQLTDLCSQVNLELTYQQKLVVIAELVSIMVADGDISPHEEELVDTIGDAFYMEEQVVQNIRNFVVGNTIQELDGDEVAFANDQKDLSSKIKHIYRAGIPGLFAFLHVGGETDCYFIKYLGKANVFMNGVALKPQKVKTLAPGSSIKRDRALPIYYGDIINQFVSSAVNTAISFEAKNIDYRFPNGELGLRSINVSENSGNLVGIMGSSGAGKSTLCNVLNGMESPSNGQILINGIDMHEHPEQVKGLIGFVPQDDLLIEDLSSYENLLYAAKLCFDNLSKKELDQLVIKTMSSLGILDIKDLKVGSPFSKTISGGQRKRLNIGLELLREPAVLFVDEPTSGLSSRDAENIMDLMKELTLKGKLIFVVIHQPSSDIFKMFDKLIILDVGGYQIYDGNPVEGVVYFKTLIDLVNNEQGECIECGNVNPEQIFNIIETKVVNEYGNHTNQRKISPKQWNQFYIEHGIDKEIITTSEAPKTSLKRPNKFQQMKVFIQRDVMSKLSNKQYLIINLVEAPVLAFILAFLLRYRESSEYLFGKNINIPAYLFMSGIVALFMGLTVSAEEIIKDRKILKREAFLNLSRSSYLLSKIIILFSISALQTLLFVLVGDGILEMKGMFLVNWGILFSISCLANIVGLNISSAFNSAVTIYILIPILIIPQLILSGVVVQFDNLNPTITSYDKVPAIGEVMASRWGFEAAMVTLYKENKYEKPFYELDKTMGQAEYKKTYYIPSLLTKLDYCNNPTNQGETKEISNGLSLLRNEINSELKFIGKDEFPDVEKLTPEEFNASVYQNSRDFLQTLKKVYSTRYNNASTEKSNLASGFTETSDKQEEFVALQNAYQNEAIKSIVTGKNQLERIKENNNRLIQKSNLIYKDPNPSHALDFREQFFTPSKHILGQTFDTLYFNVMVIWVISFLFIITLYFDILRRIIDLIGNITWTKGKEMDRKVLFHFR